VADQLRKNSTNFSDFLDFWLGKQNNKVKNKKRRETCTSKKRPSIILKACTKAWMMKRKKKFLSGIQKAGSKRIGEDISRIQIVGDEIYDERGIEPNEMITRTMIKKAYKEAKEG